jgi:methylated-DNA-[protein]-cysteine S-methyltransferase
MSKSVSTVYYYECPKPLGFLQTQLDADEKVLSAVFVSTKSTVNVLPGKIVAVLDEYFYHKKEISKSLVSKQIVGTEFQKNIWGVIQKVPFGKTITYTDMAEKAGKPRASRAAGTACGRNPVALFIPCHRVVRKQSEDYGYSWGPERKKWLLGFESKPK